MNPLTVRDLERKKMKIFLLIVLAIVNIVVLINLSITKINEQWYLKKPNKGEVIVSIAVIMLSLIAFVLCNLYI